MAAQWPAIRLFPLPNIVLFPRAVLPLHVFEERYRAMTADAIAGDRQVAMALLSPGWEKNYHGIAAIEPVICIGTILSWEQLGDGTYNFLLQGHTRARVLSERRQGPYRVAAAEPLVETPLLEIDLSRQREQLLDLFTADPLGATPVGEQFHQMLQSPMPTADIADLAAFNLIDDLSVKQSLLAETNVARRVERVIAELQMLIPALQALGRRSHGDPSMN